MVQVNKTFSRVTLSDSAESKFIKFVDALETAYGVSLSRPLDFGSAALKEFCSGLIEGKPHPWRKEIFGLGRESRFSLSFSLFLFRKVIPSKKPDLHPYMQRMSESSPLPDEGLAAFCRKWISKNMQGWDRGYLRSTHSAVLPVTSCSERGRSQGGCRGLTKEARISREEFCSYVTESVVPQHRGSSKVTTVLSAGKWRTITCPPLVDNHLRPLHKTLYNRLSEFDWLLRGDAKAKSFKGFKPADGEVFVSGDYESATDNLNLGLQKIILGSLMDECRHVPQGIRDHAMEAYSGGMMHCGEPKCTCGTSLRQGRGQMMGQLLSFPLLCLVNYLTFLYFVGPNVPVKINGDDIIFRARQEKADAWFSGVGRSGLVVSRGKTFVHKKYFTLNSTPFSSHRGGVRLVPFLRASTLWRGEEGSVEALQSLRGRFSSLSDGMSRSRAFPFRVLFLKENRHTIFTSRRSLTRALGLNPSEGELRASNLWSRELFYLDSDTEPELPSLSVSQIQGGGIPRGFVRSSKHFYTSAQIQGFSDRLAMMFADSAWEDDLLLSKDAEDLWWAKCREGTSPYGVGSLISKRVLRMLKMSRSEAWRWVYGGRNEEVWGRRRWSFGDQVWVWRGEREIPFAGEQGEGRGPIQFVRPNHPDR